MLLPETLFPRLAMCDKMRENRHPIQVRGSKAIMMCGKNPEEHWLSCQLTFCPLGSETFLDEIEEALEIIRQSGLEYEIGSMSTIVKGPGSEVLALLEETTNVQFKIYDSKVEVFRKTSPRLNE